MGFSTGKKTRMRFFMMDGHWLVFLASATHFLVSVIPITPCQSYLGDGLMDYVAAGRRLALNLNLPLPP
jgi:hypothetical protein